MKAESEFRKKVHKFIKGLKNTVAFSIQQVAICGDPDIILCIWGRFVALELKKDDESEPTPLQKWKLGQVRSRGKGLSFKVAPENWAEIKTKLEILDNGESLNE